MEGDPVLEDDIPIQFYLRHYGLYKIKETEQKKKGYLSPDTMMVCPIPSFAMAVYASSAIAKRWGSSSPLFRPL